MSYIVPQKMPMRCFECAFISSSTIDGYSCRAADKTLASEHGINISRPDWCPLIELPPHGRLIAEKTITEIRYHDADGYHIVNGEQLCELEIDAETVIEAEGKSI